MRAASRVPAAQCPATAIPSVSAPCVNTWPPAGQYGMPVQARRGTDPGRHPGARLGGAHAAAPGRHRAGGGAVLLQPAADPAPAGLRVVGVPRGAAGLDTDALDDAIRAHAPRMLFVNTVLQNPTGASLTSMNAHRVLQLAERHRLLVVEDDIYRELAPAGSPMLAAMDGLSHVIYINGFSKTIAPSLRVGYGGQPGAGQGAGPHQDGRRADLVGSDRAARLLGADQRPLRTPRRRAGRTAAGPAGPHRGNHGTAWAGTAAAAGGHVRRAGCGPGRPARRAGICRATASPGWRWNTGYGWRRAPTSSPTRPTRHGSASMWPPAMRPGCGASSMRCAPRSRRREPPGNRGTAAASRVRSGSGRSRYKFVRVRLLDAGIGHVLEAEAGLELVARPEHRTQAENVAELERGAGAMLVRCIGTAQQARTRADLRKGTKPAKPCFSSRSSGVKPNSVTLWRLVPLWGNHSASSTSTAGAAASCPGCPS